jgi:DNA sulfur modification protein DndE
MLSKRRRVVGNALAVVLGVCLANAGVAGLASAQNTPAGAGEPKLPQENIDALKQWSHAHALAAASWGAPLVTMYALRYNDAVGPKAKAAPNSLWRMENISTPELSQEAGYVTPNVNVIYGFGFLDLRREPVVLSVPDSHDRYYMIEIVDMWTNAFAYIGGKATGYQGGRYALVGPGWSGELPPGVKRIDCPTPWVLLQPRVHVYRDGKVDLAGARGVLQAIEPTGLSQFVGKPAPPAPSYDYPAPEPVDTKLPVSALVFKDPLQFWDLLSVAMNENPPPQDQVTALLPLFKPLGLELGKRWDRDKVPGVFREAMQEAAQSVGVVLSRLLFGSIVGDAYIPLPTIGNFGTDYATRAYIGRVGLTANTPYEAIYWGYYFDSEGQPLQGGRQYTMTFQRAIPVVPPGFWSITLYDAVNNYTVPNPNDRYMLGSDTPDLQKNGDGSFTLYIQSDDPGPGRRSNWLPSPPSGKFYLIPRAYAPTQEGVDILSNPKSWPVPAVVRTK